MTGTTKVDFVGTVAEARIFAAKHVGKFPGTFNVWRGGERSPNGDAVICASWKNLAQREQVRNNLAALGWQGDWGEFEHVAKKKGDK
jgi:hypothetical protein